MAKERPVIEELQLLRTCPTYWGQWMGLAVGVVVAATAAVIVSAWLTSDDAPRVVLRKTAGDGIILAGSWLAVLILLGEARIYRRRTGRQQLVGLLKAIVGGSMVAIMMRPFLLATAPLNLRHYGLATLLALGLFWLGYSLAGALWAKRLERRYLVVSDNHLGPLLSSLRNGNSYEYHEVVGSVGSDHARPLPDLRAPPGDSLWQLVPSLAQTLNANCVVVDGGSKLPTAAVQSGLKCREQGMQVLTAVSAYEQIAHKTPLAEIEEAFAGARRRPPEAAHDRYLKRVMDVVLTLVLLPIAAAIIGVCALLIKILMPGPVFYWQERVGQKGRRFYLAKLRTMVPDAEKETGPVWAAGEDERVTRLGRILRKTRMDELPQLLHVLKGEMSLVGPRPERPHFVDRLAARLPSYHDRCCVPPGITGWAQVNHHYDTCFEDVCEKLRYDTYYIRHMSWAMDLEILRRTIGVVVRGKGAR